ncbi:MAG: hypothetical protein ACE5GS_09250 [Kiloniellaceae bacterium]
MSTAEQTERAAIPLVEAAARLGISPDALRMRIRRGKAEGFKRDGHVFVYLPGNEARPPSEHVRTGATGPNEQRANAPDELRVGHREARVPGAGKGQGDPQSVVVEFQRVELSRLLKENERLNRRLDQQLEEVRQLRQMLQREQILRQQEHNLRQHLQHILERLTQTLALPQPRPEVVGEAEEPDRAPPAERAEAETEAETETETENGAETEAEFQAEAEAGSGEPARVVLRAGARQDAPAAPDTTSSSGPERRPEVDKAADLAEMLKEIGQSLRGLDSSAAAPLEAQPGAGVEEGLSEVGDGPGPGGEAIDPWDEERRNAARMMKKLFRGRNMPRDPEA